MALNVLIIGFGSIGQRHADIMSSIPEIDKVYVLSQQATSYATLNSVSEIKALNIGYIIVANKTSDHYKTLSYLNDHLSKKVVLIEKPLFDSYIDLAISSHQVFVGYNLRFHPVLKKIKSALSGRSIWTAQVLCGSYLPDWRPGRDYRYTSSARKKAGGGVLLDLSHELDYMAWLFGSLTPSYVDSAKVSNLQIETDDLLMLNATSSQGVRCQVTLNYFSQQAIRRIMIEGDGVSIQADLISSDLRMILDGQQLNFHFSKMDRNDTYLDQHRAVLFQRGVGACSYTEGLSVMKLIDSIREQVFV